MPLRFRWPGSQHGQHQVDQGVLNGAVETALADDSRAGLHVDRRAGDSRESGGRRGDDVVRVLAATGPAHISIMHSSSSDTADAIDIVKRHWQGPLGAYPESGYFKMPEWSFVDLISPDDLVDRSSGWLGQGVTTFGGCCGLGPEHIAALAKRFKRA